MLFLALGLHVSSLILIWHFVAKRTVLDHTRDKLFDLRDQIRADHLANGWGLENDAYKNLRKMLNAYLRYTEIYSIWKIISLHRNLSKNPHLTEFVRKKINTSFATKNEKQAQYIQSVREKAFVILTEFSICYSGLLIVISMVMMPYVLLKSLISICSCGLSTSLEIFKRDILHIYGTLKRVWKISANEMSNKLLDETAFNAAVIDERLHFV